MLASEADRICLEAPAVPNLAIEIASLAMTR
jgi:hypothetical protein